MTGSWRSSRRSGILHLVFGILYILTLYSVNITPLIAGAGVVGIAIALAAQDLFSNFFGGAVIITDQPLKVGDGLINDVLGDVTHIGPRCTVSSRSIKMS